MNITQSAVAEWRGRTAVGSDGDKIGTIDEIYMDAETGKPEWLAVSTGLFGMKLSFIPIAEASEAGGEVRVPYDKAQVKDAPNAEPDGELSQPEEAALYRHYGLDYSEARSESGLPQGGGRDSVGHDVSGPTTDDAMTRSEEELRVGKREVEAGRVRLRKWVETEPVQEEVELRRETVDVHREAIDQPVEGAEIGEQEIEVPLRAEQAVAEKQTVAKERITLDKDVETERDTVSGELRKERVEVEGEDAERIR